MSHVKHIQLLSLQAPQAGWLAEQPHLHQNSQEGIRRQRSALAIGAAAMPAVPAGRGPVAEETRQAGVPPHAR